MAAETQAQAKAYYRAKEAAIYLSIGLSTLWLWVKEEKIKTYKISDRVTVFKKEDLDALVTGI